MKCPHCDGTGESFAHVDFADGSSFTGMLKCSTCDGTGIVHEKRAEWVEEGQRIRDARVQGGQYRNLLEESKRLGIDVVTLSRMERGEIEPYTLKGGAL